MNENKYHQELIFNNFLYSNIYDYKEPNFMSCCFINDVKKSDFYLTSKEIDYLKEQGIRYLYLKYNANIDGKFILSLYNNYTKIKVWINGKYIGYYDDWISRIVVAMNEGENEIIIESYSPNVLDIKILISEYKKNLYDDFNDIRKTYAFFEKKDNIVSYFVQQDFFGQDDPKVEVLIPYINFKKRKINFKKINYPSISLYSKENIDLTDYVSKSDVGWIFIKINRQYKRIFLIDINESYIKIEKLIQENIHYFTEWEYEKIKETSINAKERDLSLYDKYFILYGQIVRFFGKYKYESQNDYYVSPGYKEVEYISALDEKKSIYGLYVPCNISNIKELELILVLSSHSHNTYIDTYSSFFKKNYLIVEVNLKGNNYGNYIGEYIVFEILSNIKTLFPNHIITKKYLFGYSSSASAVTTLCGKYPYEFNSCLAIAGKSNEYLLKNINATVPTIIICGNYDSDVNDIYYRNEEILNNKKIFVQNVLLNGYDHTTIHCLMRSKKLINKILNLNKQIINYGYFGISEDYSPITNIEIVDRTDKSKPYYAYVNYDKNEIVFQNVKKLKFLKTCSYKVLLKDNFGKIHNIDDSYSFAHDKVVNRLNNGMGILNTYKKGIVFWINKEDDKEIIKGFLNPKNMTKSFKNEINYPVCYIKDFKTVKYKNKNNVFYYSKEDIQFNEFLKFKNNGFYYLNKFYEGKYSVIFIQKNEYNFNLYLIDNDIMLSKNNFFMRNVFIPSEVYNVESMYKNEILILLNRKYYSVRFFGEEMEEIA